jgi:hypothetical protein
MYIYIYILMKNIIVFGYYANADGYYALINHFEKQFNKVIFIPYMKYIHEDKTTEMLDVIENILVNEEIDYILLWHNFDTFFNTQNIWNKIIELKNKNEKKINKPIQTIMINWDANIKLYNKDFSNYFDYIFVSNPRLIQNKNMYLFEAGYNSKISYYEWDGEYSCDVVFIGTNLYTDSYWENQTMNRKKLLDEIINENKLNDKDKQISLHIYSIENDRINQLYKKYHKGYIPYNKCYLAFSNAMFCLNISPLESVSQEIDGKKYFYYSERLPQIFACESVMISNNDYTPFLKPGEDYILIKHVKDITKKIKYYKENIDDYMKIKNNVILKKHLFNYETISKKIYNTIITE